MKKNFALLVAALGLSAALLTACTAPADSSQVTQPIASPDANAPANTKTSSVVSSQTADDAQPLPTAGESVSINTPQRRAPSARAQRVCLGFAAGVMLAATIWSLLIPAMESAQAQGLAPGLPAAGGIALGTAFLLLLGAWMDRLRQSGRTPAPLRQSSRETAQRM